MSRVPVHIEVLLRDKRPYSSSIKDLVRSYILQLDTLSFPGSLTKCVEHDVRLGLDVESVTCCELSASAIAKALDGEPATGRVQLPVNQCILNIHVFQLNQDSPFEETTTGDGRDDAITTCIVTDLPSRNWHGLWDSLIFPDDIKRRLLDYIYTTIVFGDAGVDFNTVSWNRLVLLHGPPGTGKTSLCHALAQKLAVRLQSRYPSFRMLEINSHSLFSRWFSESGKLVQKLFTSIDDMIEDDNLFVVVLIDEVESLTAARAAAAAGEPTDSLRVVNALLTQLDKLKHRKNVLIMATSNMAHGIDSAFVDRADIVQYIDLPPVDAIYEILRSCLLELSKKGILEQTEVADLLTLQVSTVDMETRLAACGEGSKEEPQLKDDPTSSSLSTITDSEEEDMQGVIVGSRLKKIAASCREQQMSGRTLRRLPVLAHARYIGAYPVSLDGNARPKKKRKVSSSPKANGANHPVKAENELKNGVSSVEDQLGVGTDVWLSALESVVADAATQKDKIAKH